MQTTTSPPVVDDDLAPDMLVRRPVRTIDALGDPGVRPEVVHCLSDARIVWLDRDALTSDFPQLTRDALLCRHPDLPSQSREAGSTRLVESWVLRHAAVISDEQIRQRSVNTEIPTLRRHLVAYRPPRYGRALVVSTEDSNRSLTHEDYLRWHDEPAGLLDVKGTGVAPGRTPALEGHRNGLMLLWEAFAELARQRLIEAVLRDADVAVAGVPVYAILDLGFDGRIVNGQMSPAGALVRRAHVRPIGGVELPRYGTEDHQINLEVELLLRRYGITSANHATEMVVFEGPDGLSCRYGGEPMEHIDQDDLRTLVEAVGRPLPWHLAGINVQRTRYAQLRPLQVELVDFGHYVVHRQFEHSLLSLVLDRFLQWGGALWTDDEDWVQPDPERAVRHEHAGPRPVDDRLAPIVGVEPGTVLDAEIILGLELAQRWRERTIDAAGIESEIAAYVQRATAWSDEGDSSGSRAGARAR